MSRTASKRAHGPTKAGTRSTQAGSGNASSERAPKSAAAVNSVAAGHGGAVQSAVNRDADADESTADESTADESTAADRDGITSGAPGRIFEADEEILRLLAEHQARLPNWKVCGLDLGREHRRMMKWALLLIDELMPSKWEGTAIQRPRFIRITFDIRPARQLGSYIFGRSLADGLPLTINVNPVPMVSRSPAQNVAVVLHELLHMWQDLFRLSTGGPIPKGASHDAEFLRRAAQLGIPCTSRGYELGLVPQSDFDRFLTRHRVPRQCEYMIIMQKGAKRSGRIVRGKAASRSR